MYLSRPRKRAAPNSAESFPGRAESRGDLPPSLPEAGTLKAVWVAHDGSLRRPDLGQISGWEDAGCSGKTQFLNCALSEG